MVVKTSQSIAHVARELNVNETTLGNWVKEYGEAHADDEPALPVSELARLRELERENRELNLGPARFTDYHPDELTGSVSTPY
jgi:transposase-like protein